jgi:endonuclease YncB( thermonuclease family)
MSLLFLLAAVTPSVCPVVSSEFPITITRVKDGDTFVGSCTDRFGKPETYRVLGDTPEKGWLAKCPEEQAYAKKATAYAEDMVRRAGGMATGIHQGDDKYGRILVDVTLMIDGKPVNWSEEMKEQGFMIDYDGGTKSNWCEILKGQK